jgi:hypothetical protein
MSESTLRQSVKDTNHGKTDGTETRDMHNDNALSATQGCHKKHTATCKPKGSKRKLPYEKIQRLHEQGLTGVAIAKQLGLKSGSVSVALRKLGLGTGLHRHEREVLPDGKIRCSVCSRSKKAIEFPRTGSRCKPCGYGHMAMQSNQSLDKAIHVRNLWFHNRAKRLGIYYDLTDEQLTELYVLQDGRCVYCGEPMVLKLGIRRSGCSASIERILPDMLGGTYTIRNVLWVHIRCNSRRWALAGEKLKQKFPEASRVIERVAVERQLELPFPLDSEITVTNDPEPQPSAA